VDAHPNHLLRAFFIAAAGISTSTCVVDPEEADEASLPEAQ
jgi:hypothetical protein